jgi:hypothetical protein
MPTQLPPTVSPLEIIWTIVTSIGVALASINCWDAYGDLAALRNSGRNGVLLLAAYGELSDQRLILLCLACKFLMGIMAMSAMSSVESDGDPTVASYVIPILMIVVAGALITLSYTKKIRRNKIAVGLRTHQEELAQQRHLELTQQLEALHSEVGVNTKLTEQAAVQASAAYQEANSVNTKIAATAKAGQVASEAGNKLMGALTETGDDTNTRVRIVEIAVVQNDEKTDTANTRADTTDTRLDKLEAVQEENAAAP